MKSGIVIHPRKKVYWSIPKNACTTLKTHYAKMLGLRHKGLVHDVNFERTDDPNQYPDYYQFCIVRNPYTRLYSLYKNKILSNHQTDKDYKNGVELQVFAPWIDKFDGKMSFSDFINSITSINKYEADVHFAPQSFIVPISDEIDYIRFENWPNTFRKYNKTKYEIPWHKIYSSEMKVKVFEYYIEDFQNFKYSL